MRNSTRLVSVALMMLLVLTRLAKAEDVDPAAKKLVEEVVATAGGEEKLLKLFRFRERVLITSTPAAPVTADEKENRTSVVQVSGDVDIGNRLNLGFRIEQDAEAPRPAEDSDLVLVALRRPDPPVAGDLHD